MAKVMFPYLTAEITYSMVFIVAVYQTHASIDSHHSALPGTTPGDGKHACVDCATTHAEPHDDKSGQLGGIRFTIHTILADSLA